MAKNAFHIFDGPTTFPYDTDAIGAVSRHPYEWSLTPWSPEDAAAGRKRFEEEHARLAEEAKALGRPGPGPMPVPPPAPTPEEQAAIDAHAHAVEEAKERLRVADEKLAKQKIIDDQIAADRALVVTPPPRSDPTARRPFGRPGEPTPAERTLYEKQAKQRAEKAAQDQEAARVAAAKAEAGAKHG